MILLCEPFLLKGYEITALRVSGWSLLLASRGLICTMEYYMFFLLALHLIQVLSDNYSGGLNCTETHLGPGTLRLELTYRDTGQRVMAQPLVVMASLLPCERVHAAAYILRPSAFDVTSPLDFQWASTP